MYSFYHKDIEKDKNGGYWIRRESWGFHIFRKYFLDKFVFPVFTFIIKALIFFLIWTYKIMFFPFIALWKLIFKKKQK